MSGPLNVHALAEQEFRIRDRFFKVTDDPFDHKHGAFSNIWAVASLEETLFKESHVIQLPVEYEELKRLAKEEIDVVVMGEIVYKKPKSADDLKYFVGSEEKRDSEDISSGFHKEWFEGLVRRYFHHSQSKSSGWPSVDNCPDIFKGKTREEISEILKQKHMPMSSVELEETEKLIKDIYSPQIRKDRPARMWLASEYISFKPGFIKCVDRKRNLVPQGHYWVLDEYMKRFEPRKVDAFGKLVENNDRIELETKALHLGWGNHIYEAMFCEGNYFIGITPD